MKKKVYKLNEILLPRRESLQMISANTTPPEDSLELLEEVNLQAAEHIVHPDAESPSQLSRQIERVSARFIA